MKTTIEAMFEEVNHSPSYMRGFIDACGALNQIEEKERISFLDRVEREYEREFSAK